MFWLSSQHRQACQKKQRERQDRIKQLSQSFHEPMNNDDAQILGLSVADLVASVQSGKANPADILVAYGKKALKAHTELNCLTEVMIASAEVWARECNRKGPLAGMPISLKDTVGVKGWDASIGYSAWVGKPMLQDSALVRLLRDAGAVPFVKTNVPITLLSFESASDVFGRTNNPHKKGYSPGGSTGGEGALLAYGGSRIGIGTDVAGSVRVPAHYSGIYTIRASAQRFVKTGCATSIPGQEGVASVYSPMTRTLDDLETIWKAVVSMKPWDYDHSCLPIPWRDIDLSEGQILKWGVMWDDGVVAPSPACFRALRTVTDTLAKHGHKVVTIDPPSPYEGLKLASQILLADGGTTAVKPFRWGESNDLGVRQFMLMFSLPHWVKRLYAWYLRRIRKDEIYAGLIENWHKKTVEQYLLLIAQREEYRKRWMDMWRDQALDFVLTVPNALPAVPHGGMKCGFKACGYTFLFNMLDYSAGVLPISHVDSTLDKQVSTFKARNTIEAGAYTMYDSTSMHGLPVGVQVICKRLEEEKVLEGMKVIDRLLRQDGIGYELLSTNLRQARQTKESKSYVKIGQFTVSDDSKVTTPVEGPSGTMALDGLYKHIPSIMMIRSSTTSGRGIWAKEMQKAGSVLLSVKPHVAILSNNYLDSYCSSCVGPAPETGLKRCTRCRIVWYCDPICQKKDWTLHKFECAALQKWAEKAPSQRDIPNDAIRSLGRIIWMKRAGGISAKEIDNMQSNRSSLQPSAFELHTQLAHSLVRYLGLSSSSELTEFGLSSPCDIVDIISRFITNTFTLTSPSLTPVGTAVSPLVALINHSCDPNAVVVFPRSSSDPLMSEPLMQVIALRDINPDEEVLTAYIDTTLARTSRQQALQETYNFLCCCPLCADRSVVDPRESMWCPKSCGGVCPLPTEENSFTRCTICKAVVSSIDVILDVLRVGQEGLDKATALQFKDISQAKRLTTNLIPILNSAGLTPSCHPLLAMTRLHQSLVISSFPDVLNEDVLNEAIRMAARAVAGMSNIFPLGHPARGIALAELGKLLAVDEPAPSTQSVSQIKFPPSGPRRLQLACETLVKARNELIIGFGMTNDGGKIGMEVRETLVSLEKELGVWNRGIRNVFNDMPETE